MLKNLSRPTLPINRSISVDLSSSQKKSEQRTSEQKTSEQKTKVYHVAFLVICMLLCALLIAKPSKIKDRKEKGWACLGSVLVPLLGGIQSGDHYEDDFEIIDTISESAPFYGAPDVAHDWVDCNHLKQCTVGQSEARATHVSFHLGLEMPGLGPADILGKMKLSVGLTHAQHTTKSGTSSLVPFTPSMVRLLHSFEYVNITARVKAFQVNDCGLIKDAHYKTIKLKAPTSNQGIWRLEYKTSPMIYEDLSYNLRNKTVDLDKFQHWTRVTGVPSPKICGQLVIDHDATGALWQSGQTDSELSQVCDVFHAGEQRGRMYCRSGNFLGFFSSRLEAAEVTHSPKLKTRWIATGKCDMVHVFSNDTKHTDTYSCIILPPSKDTSVVFRRTHQKGTAPPLGLTLSSAEWDRTDYNVEGVSFDGGESIEVHRANNPKECSKFLRNSAVARFAVFEPETKGCSCKAASKVNVSTYDQVGSYLGNLDFKGSEKELTFDSLTVKQWVRLGECDIIQSWMEKVVLSEEKDEEAFVYRCVMLKREEASKSKVTIIKRDDTLGMDLQSRLRKSGIII